MAAKITTYLKLRANVELAGDVELAREELSQFYSAVTPIASVNELVRDWSWALEHITSAERQITPIGFTGSGKLSEIDAIIKRISFVQELWFEAENLPAEIGDSVLVARYTDTKTKKDLYCAIPFMAAAEALTKLSKINGDVPLRFRDLLSTSTTKKRVNQRQAINNGMSSTPHVHGLHKYKAKFFPRFTRAMINSIADTAPKNAEGEVVLLDPFVGSGTAQVEASLLGFPSRGIDIDPLSCLISQAKLYLLDSSPEQVGAAVKELSAAYDKSDSSADVIYTFPSWIAKKFTRWNAESERQMYEQEIQKWKTAITSIDDAELRAVFEVCLSDVLTRKFNMRMLGTGVGRFALEIAKSKISTLMFQNLQYAERCSKVCKVLRDSYALKMPDAVVIQGDARKMPLPSESISMVVTSPPYLPASSGRENYLKGKSVSLTALGLLSEEQMRLCDTASIGAMKQNGMTERKDLPQGVYDLVDWLKADPLREIKAEPILSYYTDLSAALKETNRVLIPGSTAIYVVGKESIFYTFATRAVLRRVPCAEIFTELAENAGFEIVRQRDIELDKKNKNARPRSLDAYFESAVYLRK